MREKGRIDLISRERRRGGKVGDDKAIQFPLGRDKF